MNARPIPVIFLVFLVILAIILLVCPGPLRPSGPAHPDLLKDTDSDGFNDWFEINIAGYDPSVPNNRYVIIYFRMLDHPDLEPYVVDNSVKFLTEKGEIPTENIIVLAQEKANAKALESAIEQIAKKSNENDLVFLKIYAHGGTDGVSGNTKYTKLNEWINNIKARAVIVTIKACYSEYALPVLKDGAYPRIVFAQTGIEFIFALGAISDTFIRVDTKHGNNDGYISLAEITNWLDKDPMCGPDWGRLREEGRSHIESEGYSKMSDTSNIAHLIYFTDYTVYDTPPILKNS